MDIVEFAESCMNVSLPEWQKAALRDLYELQERDSKKLYIVMRPFNGRSAFYTYLKQHNLPISKELNKYGTTPTNY